MSNFGLARRSTFTRTARHDFEPERAAPLLLAMPGIVLTGLAIGFDAFTIGLD